MALLLETTVGDLVFDLDIENSPDLARNILKLAKARYYTKTLLYNLIHNRFVEGGDPTGTGTGGTCINGLLQKGSNNKCIQATGLKLTNTEKQESGRLVVKSLVGSQFIITLPGLGLEGYPDDFYSVGTIAEGTEILEKLNTTYCDPSGRPYADIRIERALVIHDPFDDPPGMDDYLREMCVFENDSIIVRSPSPERPVEEKLPTRISAADVVQVDSENEEEINKQMKQQAELTVKSQDKSRAVVLEMLGDLPDADIKAPENVLFICQLNPITVAEDLELIFSRFDEAVKVEIICDRETGNSLQYGFAEFSNKKAAEEAYFKMNNVLIDDRRIKVDFSQSVSKLWDKYNQKARVMPHLNVSDRGPRRHDNNRGLQNQRGRRHDRDEQHNRGHDHRHNNGERQLHHHHHGRDSDERHHPHQNGGRRHHRDRNKERDHHRREDSDNARRDSRDYHQRDDGRYRDRRDRDRRHDDSRRRRHEEDRPSDRVDDTHHGDRREDRHRDREERGRRKHRRHREDDDPERSRHRDKEDHRSHHHPDDDESRRHGKERHRHDSSSDSDRRRKKRKHKKRRRRSRSRSSFSH